MIILNSQWLPEWTETEPLTAAQLNSFIRDVFYDTPANKMALPTRIIVRPRCSYCGMTAEESDQSKCRSCGAPL